MSVFDLPLLPYLSQGEQDISLRSEGTHYVVSQLDLLTNTIVQQHIHTHTCKHTLLVTPVQEYIHTYTRDEECIV